MDLKVVENKAKVVETELKVVEKHPQVVEKFSYLLCSQQNLLHGGKSRRIERSSDVVKGLAASHCLTEECSPSPCLAPAFLHLLSLELWQIRRTRTGNRAGWLRALLLKCLRGGIPWNLRNAGLRVLWPRPLKKLPRRPLATPPASMWTSMDMPASPPSAMCPSGGFILRPICLRTGITTSTLAFPDSRPTLAAFTPLDIAASSGPCASSPDLPLRKRPTNATNTCWPTVAAVCLLLSTCLP